MQGLDDAVAVADRFRGRGIASLLLQRITARPRAADIYCLIALCLMSNGAFLRLLSRLGPMTTAASAPGVVEVRIDRAPGPASRPSPERTAEAVSLAHMWRLCATARTG
jgi:GNAT superfamily N-acetyltransferase